MKQPTRDLEKMARAIISGFNGDPDMPVQAGSPQIFGTPNGECFAVAPGADVPLWRFYISAAEKMLAAARSIDASVSDAA